MLPFLAIVNTAVTLDDFKGTSTTFTDDPRAIMHKMFQKIATGIGRVWGKSLQVIFYEAGVSLF